MQKLPLEQQERRKKKQGRKALATPPALATALITPPKGSDYDPATLAAYGEAVMLDIAALFRSRQQKFASRTPVAPARTTAPPWPERLILGVHSLEPSANIVPNLPEFLALGRALTEKGLKRQYRTRHSPAVGGSDLVSKSISEHTLPVYTRYSPAESTYYRVFHRDTYLVRNDPEMTAREPAGSTRGTIYELSRKSEARLSHLCKNSGHRIKSQLCLTYHEQNPIDGAEVKKHLSRFLAALRRAIPRVGYLWILEFQKRGVPHFHIFLTAPPDREAQKILSASWVRITAGTEKQYRWHIRPNNWIEWHMQNGNYVAHKYLTKHYQKDVPHQYHSVGRYWGNSRNMVPIPTIIMPEEIASNSYSQQWDS
ncbi:MAG: hypothetical protein EOM12_15475, partial [Verrucomicrobiae bacterium]|nr:hypothetical protein [Verrucomicrobiae bacterium]